MRQEQLNLFGSNDESNSGNKRKVVVVPLDTFILLAVVILLLFVLAFSLGIERGRRIQVSRLENSENLDKTITRQVTLNPIQTKIPIQPVVVKPETKMQSANISVSLPKPQVTTTEVITKKEGQANAEPLTGYYIQIASYNKDSFAQAEAKKLKDKGFPVFVSRKGDFFVLYVGSFKTKQEAQNSIGLLKRNYNDCILRRF